MTNVIEVNISLLEQDVQAVTEKIGTVKNSVNKLVEIISELDRIWESDSKKIYISKLEQDKENLQTLLSEAERLIDKMDMAAGNYKDCEKAVSQEVEQIKV